MLSDARAFQDDSSEPDCKRPAEMKVLRSPQSIEQVFDNSLDFENVSGPLKTEKLGDESLVQRVVGHTAFIKDEVLLGRSIAPKAVRHRGEEFGHFLRGLPRLVAVVDDDGKDRGKAVLFANFARFDEIAKQQGRIGEDSERHPVILRALKLKDEYSIAPFVFFPANSPNYVVISLTEIVGDVVAGAAFQSGEVEILDKVFGDEIPQKRFDHGRIAEQGLVGGIVWESFAHVVF